jgi:hypothetical protein
MVQRNQPSPAKLTMPNIDPAELAEMGKKQIEAMIEVQKEFIEGLNEANREWAARVKAETDLASEFTSKLTAAKSIPDTAAICQEWMSRHMAMFAEDSRRFVAGTQKFMATTARLLPNAGTGGSS